MSIRYSRSSSYSYDENDFIVYGQPTALNCYSRFIAVYGDEIFQQMAALDTKTNEQFTRTIVDFIGKHYRKPSARKILWQYSDAGNREAKSILYGNASSIPQGIDRATLERAIQR
jgi:hypothetical protein